MSRKAQAKILAVLTATPGLSVDEVAAVTGYTPASCQHHISELTRRGSLLAATASPADHVQAAEPQPPTTPYPYPDPEPAAEIRASIHMKNSSSITAHSSGSSAIGRSREMWIDAPDDETPDPRDTITVRDGDPTAAIVAVAEADLEAMRTPAVPPSIAASILAMPEADRPSMEFVASLGLTEPEPVVVEDLRADLIAWPGHVRLWAAATAERLGITVDELRGMATGVAGETYGSLAGRIARGELV